MKVWKLLPAVGLIACCENFPSNPEPVTDPMLKAAVSHTATHYVPIDPPGEGLVARKVNVLCLRIKASNFSAEALEILGKAEISGPPQTKDHAFRFRTDRSDVTVTGAGFTGEVLDGIHEDSTYTLFRFILPMNEYSPFEDTQGMVLGIHFNGIWAIDASGARQAVSIEETEP